MCCVYNPAPSTQYAAIDVENAYTEGAGKVSRVQVQSKMAALGFIW